MSQYPPNPSYNPYEQRPNDPNAGSGTSYGGNTPPGPQNPYNPYPGNPPSGPQNPYPGNPPSGPGSNPGQYGAYPPAQAPAPPPPTAPNTDYNPYDPYSPTYVNTNPNAAYGAYQQPTYQAPPPAFPTAPAPPQQPTPKRKGPSTMLIVLVVIGLVVIVGGIVGALVYNNGQKSNANATATAGASATSAAQANANASATANAALTATAVTSTYPFSTNVVLNDPLSDNSKGFGWQTGSGCAFSGSAYHVTDSQTNTFNDCFGLNTNYSNFTFQAEMVVSKGDGGGLVFRGNADSGKIYRLTFYTDGTYGLYIYVDNTGTNARILKDGSYGSNVDLTVTHTVGIVAKGNSLTIYFDKQMIDTVTDSTFSSGQIGFNAYDITNAVDAEFTNAEVWQLP